MLRNSLFGAVKLTKNPDPNKYSYIWDGISFEVHGTFSLLNLGFGKNMVILGVDTSSSVHVDHQKKKDVLVLDNRPTQGLDDTTLTAEAEYSINFTKPKKKLSLSPHYNGSKLFIC